MHNKKDTKTQNYLTAPAALLLYNINQCLFHLKLPMLYSVVYTPVGMVYKSFQKFFLIFFLFSAILLSLCNRLIDYCIFSLIEMTLEHNYFLITCKLSLV